MESKSQYKKRILTGDNTTGRLHLGHYVGSLENRVKLQDEYETFIILADMHALAYPKYVGNTAVVSDSVRQVTMDNLAVGLDPEKISIFPESLIPEIYEIAIIFSMLATHNRVLRNPTLKDEIRDKQMGDNFSLGFINFPVLQAADILGLKATLVPVGEDQLPHIELTNEIGRKFNSTYGEVFPEVQGLVGKVKRLVGTDGNAKMTKSLNNCIYLSDSEEDLKQKVMSMYTDPSRIRATDPGKVEGNPVFMYHDAFNPNLAEVAELKERYLTGKVGDVEVKQKLFVCLNNFLAPIREKRSKYQENPQLVEDIIQAGATRVRGEVLSVLNEMREKMQFFGKL